MKYRPTTTTKEQRMLRALAKAAAKAERVGKTVWVTPSAIGGTSGSSHSGDLQRLASKGLVLMHHRNPDKLRGSRVYRLSTNGMRALNGG